MAMTGRHRAAITATSATIRPSSSADRLIGVMHSRSKYPPWMSVTSAGALDIPVTAKAMAMGRRKAL